MIDILPTLEQWSAQGRRAVVATVVSVERSGPKGPGASMAIADDGQVAGSVTGGCVEPDLIIAAEQVMADGRLLVREYGIADDDAFDVGLPCGGAVRIMLQTLNPDVVAALVRAVRDESTMGVVTGVTGPAAGTSRIVDGPDIDDAAWELIRSGTSGLVGDGDDERFVMACAPRPKMYIFGAVDFAAALATVGHFIGYRVIVCDARAVFVTPERFPDADELIVDWPHRVIQNAQVDERTAICVLTHDAKFDVPALHAALATNAGYIGAMGSRRTTERRETRLRDDGVADSELARVHAPIGLSIRSKTPQEVAVAICAEIIQTMRSRTPQATGARG